MKGFSYA
jgi:hypothetical protein